MKRHALILSATLALAAVEFSHAQLPTVVHANRPKPAFTMADLKAQVPQNKDGTFLMEIPKLLNTANDREVQSLLAGQRVETIGQIVPEIAANADGRRLRICRTQLACCAEHARECSVLIEFAEKAPAFKELSWVKLLGTVSYRQQDGKTIPVITVREIKETAKPTNPLLQ